MPNLASLLKHEITRLSRREIRLATTSVRKATSAFRHDIAALKRQVAELERNLARQEKARREPIITESGDRPLRFVAKGFRAHRARLGLSAAQVAQLLGSVDQSVYNWESGKSKPGKAMLEKIAAFRRMGKREALERLKMPASKKG
ncbi:MAG: helix-turn-helix domain-containing protein [Sulfuricaulis sp.]